MNHWDRRAERLLIQARSVETIPEGARARVRASLSATIAIAGAAGAASVTTSALAKLPAAVKAASTLMPSALVASAQATATLYLAPVAVGLALGLSAVGASEAIFRGSAASVSSNVRAGESQNTTSARPPKALGDLATVANEPAPTINPAEPDVAVTRAAPSGKKPVRLVPSLTEEANLLERARLVLRQGDPELSLRLLDQHRREFPEGALLYEAQTTRAIALCRSGRTDEGLRILSRLEATSQASGMLAQVRLNCEAAHRSAP